ncbi:MAG: acyl carrier protein [Bacteroidales bacterium]|nr:acyl carrier protein [Bacteroidales bacterium]MBR6991179.1 acyl carrier protein [Bacteroidales bacterium]
MEKSFEQLSTEIVELVAEHLGYTNAINLDDRLDGVLCADSIDIVELIMYIEGIYDVELPEHETGQIKTVRDIVNHVYNAINQK